MTPSVIPEEAEEVSEVGHTYRTVNMDSPSKRFKYLENKQDNENRPPAVSLQNYTSVKSLAKQPSPPSKWDGKRDSELKEMQKERAKAQTLEKEKNRRAIEEIDSLLMNIKNTFSRPAQAH